ncbi:MAG: hypothetical protein R3A52_18080 [Polyangiales bacterium]
MNAYQKGRGYAQNSNHRRGHRRLGGLEAPRAQPRRGAYEVRVDVAESGLHLVVHLPAWRRPRRHCKHVAALLVPLRDG